MSTWARVSSGDITGVVSSQALGKLTHMLLPTLAAGVGISELFPMRLPRAWHVNLLDMQGQTQAWQQTAAGRPGSPKVGLSHTTTAWTGHNAFLPTLCPGLELAHGLSAPWFPSSVNRVLLILQKAFGRRGQGDALRWDWAGTRPCPGLRTSIPRD